MRAEGPGTTAEEVAEREGGADLEREGAREGRMKGGSLRGRCKEERRWDG